MQADKAMDWREQGDVVRLNTREFFEGGARGISQTGALTPSWTASSITPTALLW